MSEPKTVEVDLSLPIGVFLLFLALKLGGVVGWSWVWITAPLWITAAVLLIGLVLFLVVSVWLGDKLK